MFTFVIWVIGLSIMAVMAYVNFFVTVLAFHKHWLLGTCCILISGIGWLALLASVF